MRQTVSTTLSQKIDALRRCRYFTGLSSAVLAELAQGAALWHCERGEALFWQDEPCSGLHIIARGAVKLFKVSPQGREFIFRVLDAGATFNEVSVFDGGLNPLNAATLEESDLWVVEAAVVQQAIRNHPEMYQAVVLNLTHNLRMFVNMIEELSFYQVTHRLARLLSQLPADTSQRGAASRLTQDQLAAHLGTVREVMARSLRELERSGAIRVERRQIYVVDKAILQQWVEATEN